MPKGLLAGQFFKTFLRRMCGDIHHPFPRLQKLLYIGDQFAAHAGAGHNIGLCYGFGLCGESLRVTAGQHRYGGRVFALAAPQPLAAFFVAARSHGTAVDNINVGGILRPNDFIPVLKKKLLQCPGLVLVHFAAQCIKTCFQTNTSFFSQLAVVMLLYKIWRSGTSAGTFDAAPARVPAKLRGNKSVKPLRTVR
ncbi:hypothetical protein SDC9_116452 [bioreactor metagenome]|uniref:Uncharacterized protein n=1 Tax=bioreactor metagenome TaxID=1076179 RepID=A0A645BWE3_9ZZZZ